MMPPKKKKKKTTTPVRRGTALARRELTVVQRQAVHLLGPTLDPSAAVSIDPRPYPKGFQFRLPDQRVTVPEPSVLVFVDDLPGANWGHPCRYLFHRADTGELLAEHAAQFPPTLHEEVVLTQFHGAAVEKAHAPAKVFTPIDWRTILRVPKVELTSPHRRFAVLFTGQISNTRHVADLEFAWRTLIHVYGFDPGDVYVLCYDGTIDSTDSGAIGKWGGDNSNYQMQVWRSGSKANLQAAFNEIGGEIGSDDLLLVHTNNHGSTTGLCLDSSSVLTPSEFGAVLSGLPAFGSLVVMMEQCYSGAFKDDTLNNSTASQTVFTSAAPYNEVSWGGSPFDAFAGVWIEAIAGAHANGGSLSTDPDVNNNGRVSMKEAFNYANSNDTSGDHPVYADSPAGCGAYVWLGQVSIFDLIKNLHLYLEEIVIGRIPLPDPPPDRVFVALGDPVAERATKLRQQLVGLAKALGPSTG
jgi:hypothetical protein